MVRGAFILIKDNIRTLPIYVDRSKVSEPLAQDIFSGLKYSPPIFSFKDSIIINIENDSIFLTIPRSEIIKKAEKMKKLLRKQGVHVGN